MNSLMKNKPLQLTAISGILIILGIICLKLNYTILPVIIFILSFLIGGYYQAKEGLEEFLDENKLSVDILMVLAAVGASLIGYWLEGALLIFIFSLSGSLEEYVLNKSQDAITSLMNLQPEIAKRYTSDGEIEEVATSELRINDRLLVSKGAYVPTDGILVQGESSFNESAITGESLPVFKKVGCELFGGSLNTENSITMMVTKDNSETVVAKIIRLVEEAQATPSKTSSFIDKIEGVYVKSVLIGVPLMIAVFYFILNWTLQESFYRGMVLLTVASPCALIASASPAILSAISNGARKGILYKGGIYLEQLANLDAIVFDKTGTLTEGKPSVEAAFFTQIDRKEEIQGIVHALEYTSSHPLAIALCDYSKEHRMTNASIKDLQDHTGYGIEGVYQEQIWKIGKQEFMSEMALYQFPYIRQMKEAQNLGKTVIFVQCSDEIVASYVLFDAAKQESEQVIEYFNQIGVKTILLTGDSQAAGETLAQSVHIQEVYGNCLPDQKSQFISKLKESYPIIAMVGDGINDAPALANATIGIAVGTGTDVALEVADMVLMKDQLTDLVYSHKLSQRLKKITVQNIIFSLSVIFLLILANLFQHINLPIGVVGHEGSTILVILNGLRLLLPVSHLNKM